jgi:hypothetical protein
VHGDVKGSNFPLISIRFSCNPEKDKMQVDLQDNDEERAAEKEGKHGAVGEEGRVDLRGGGSSGGGLLLVLGGSRGAIAENWRGFGHGERSIDRSNGSAEAEAEAEAAGNPRPSSQAGSCGEEDTQRKYIFSIFSFLCRENCQNLQILYIHTR